MPDFPVKPTFFIEDNNLPFDLILKEKTLEYASTENCEALESQSIYYYRYSDFEQYMVFRCLEERSTLEKPELREMSSNTFCFEHYLNKIGKTLENKL